MENPSPPVQDEHARKRRAPNGKRRQHRTGRKHLSGNPATWPPRHLAQCSCLAKNKRLMEKEVPSPPAASPVAMATPSLPALRAGGSLQAHGAPRGLATPSPPCQAAQAGLPLPITWRRDEILPVPLGGEPALPPQLGDGQGNISEHIATNYLCAAGWRPKSPDRVPCYSRPHLCPLTRCVSPKDSRT